MKDLEVEKIAIGELLSKRFFFKIPHYQRPFSWEQANFEDLIDDLITADPEGNYFLGTFVLHRTDDENNFDIVDGQQRLTSLLILLACLRDSVDETDYADGAQNKIVEPRSVVDGVDERQRVEVRDRAGFDDHIIAKGGTNNVPSDLNKPDPLRRILLAVKTFKERLSSIEQAEIKRLITYISQRTVVIVLQTEDFDEAFRLFAVVNDRGKQLRRIDVLKAQNLTPDLIATEGRRTKISSEWENLENEIGEDVFESIFYLIRLSVLKDKPQGDLLKEFDNRIFRPGIINRGQSFFDEVFKYTKTFADLFIDKTIIPQDHADYNRYRSLIHIMDQEFRASEWRAVLVSYCRKFGSNGLLKFLFKLEQQFLFEWLSAIRKDERYGTYAKLLAAIEASADPEATLKSFEDHTASISKLVANSRLYGSTYAKYILLRLEVSTAEHDRVHEFSAKSIEHVLPQNPEDDSEWKSLHPDESRSEYVHSVGNLVLLSKGKNASAGRKEFEAKKETYLRGRVSDYPRSVQVLGIEAWTREIIAERSVAAGQLVSQEF